MSGYIAVDGTSLTVIDTTQTNFRFMLIAYTQQKIVVAMKRPGDRVNLGIFSYMILNMFSISCFDNGAFPKNAFRYLLAEVDIMGKYIEKFLLTELDGRSGLVAEHLAKISSPLQPTLRSSL